MSFTVETFMVGPLSLLQALFAAVLSCRPKLPHLTLPLAPELSR